MTTARRFPKLAGLYVVLDPSARTDRTMESVLRSAVAGGARIFQYRNKSTSLKEAYAEAWPLRRIAAELDVLFIVNDRCDLALAVEADGVHLGQTDLPYSYARMLMGPNKLIGLSTHNEHQVRDADRLKPDYIGFGPIFTPASKQDHDPVVGIAGLARVRSLTSLPIFAIGGIGPEQVRAVMRTGANGIAVISAVLKAPDVTQAVRDLIARMNGASPPVA
jgi:thiamine-phosphate pyrophosphorylase